MPKMIKRNRKIEEEENYSHIQQIGKCSICQKAVPFEEFHELNPYLSKDEAEWLWLWIIEDKKLNIQCSECFFKDMSFKIEELIDHH